MNDNPSFIVIMGVSGCGKTTVGLALARQLSWDFFDADDDHPAENKAKMACGIPLEDQDRAPWLAILHDLIADAIAAHRPGILGCSALKQRYRDQLAAGNPRLRFVYLRGSYDLIWERMQRRQRHYMKASLLQSQFEALEEPTPAEAAIIYIEKNLEDVVQEIRRRLEL